jgi:hypothetical protein
MVPPGRDGGRGVILLTGTWIAARYNLLYGWDFSGILIPALLALACFSPIRLITTGAEALLLVALVSHAVMRIWSAVDFIPKRLAFERATPGTVDPAAARRWSRRSLLRLPLDLVTCGALGLAVIQAARLA